MYGVTNIFELLSDEGGETGAPAKEKTQERKTGTAPPGKTKGTSQPPAQTRGPAQQGRPSEAKKEGGRGKPEGAAKPSPRGENRGPPRSTQQRGPRKPREEGAGGTPVEDLRKTGPRDNPERDRQRRERKELERQRDRAARPPREGGDGAPSGRPSKRPFDHHISGTGHRRGEQKKGGHGRGNWGTLTERAEAVNDTAEVKKEDAESATGEAAPSEPTAQQGEGATEAAPEAAKEGEGEPEKKTMSYEEYLKTRKAPSIALPPARQVESQTQWTGFQPVKRDEEEGKGAKKATQKEKEKEKKKEGDAEAIRMGAAPYYKPPREDKPPRSGGRGRGAAGASGGDRRGDRKPPRTAEAGKSGEPRLTPEEFPALSPSSTPKAASQSS